MKDPRDKKTSYTKNGSYSNSKKTKKYSFPEYEKQILNELVHKKIIKPPTFKIADVRGKEKQIQKLLISTEGSEIAECLIDFWDRVKDLPEPLITVSPEMKEVIEKILNCAGMIGHSSSPLFPMDLFPLTILITGATGVGKRVVARTIHELRKRSKKEVYDALIDTYGNITTGKYDSIDDISVPLYFFRHSSHWLHKKSFEEIQYMVKKELDAFRRKKEKDSKEEFRVLSISSGTPDTLIESELFGHTKGAFTGAIQDKSGILDIDKGTIFIDEIGDASLPIQAKLMELLDERKFRKIGKQEYEGLPEDVIFILATNKDLEKEIHEKRFRPDLYYRINKIRIELPELMVRGEDLRVLAQWFAHRIGYEIPDELIKELYLYEWPGNIRELKSTVELACFLARSKGRCKLTHEDFPVLKTKASIKTLGQAARAGIKLKDIDSQYAYEVYRLCKKKTVTAKRLGISRKTASDLIEKHEKLTSKKN